LEQPFYEDLWDLPELTCGYWTRRMEHSRFNITFWKAEESKLIFMRRQVMGFKISKNLRIKNESLKFLQVPTVVNMEENLVLRTPRLSSSSVNFWHGQLTKCF